MIYTLLDRLPIGWALKFAIFRLLARWRSFLTVIVGVLLSAIIGANVPLYTSTVSQVGLLERLQQNPLEDIHIYSRVAYRADADGVNTIETLWQDLNTQVQAEIDATFNVEIPNWVAHSITGLETSPYPVTHNGESVDGTRLRIAHYSDWQAHISVVEGTLPQAPTDSAIDIEVAIPFQAAVTLNFAVGDDIILTETTRDTSQPIRARITAIVTEADFTDPLWFAPSPLRVEQGSQLEANLLTTRESAIMIAQTFVPDTWSRLHWRVVFDYTQLAFNDTSLAITQLRTFEDNLELILNFPSSSYVYTNDVIPIIADYQDEVSRLNAPFGLLLLQIGALVLLFLVVIVALVRRGERREIAMLKSRGSFDSQIILIRGLEALIVCVSATLIAPFIAQQVLILLTPSLMNVERITLDITHEAFIFSAIASGSALIILILTLRPVLKLPLISAGGSAIRGNTQMWWQRYYLDILLIIIGIAGLWQLINNETTVVEESSGEALADPLLLLTPALLFLALGSALLRFFPIVMQFFSRLFSTLPGLGSALAGWQVSRESIHYARVTFLLALAVGIGWFATSFQATITRSQRDQALYRVGSDLRLDESTRTTNTTPPPLDVYLNTDGVESATQVLRFDDIGVSIFSVSFNEGDLLAIDNATFANTAFWRDDLGDLPAPAQDEGEEAFSGRAIGVDPVRIELWARMDDLLFVEGEDELEEFDRESAVSELVWQTDIAALLINPDGTAGAVQLFFDEIEGLAMEDVADINANINDEEFVQDVSDTLSGWVHFSADLSAIEALTLNEETRFGGLWITTNIPFGANQLFELQLTEFAITGEDGTIVGENWLLDDGWQLDLVQTTFEQPFGTFETTGEALRPDGSGGLALTWFQVAQVSISNLGLDTVEDVPVPAIVSQSFADLNNLDVGLTFPLTINQVDLTFEITDVVDYFPTLYQERPFIITDFNTFANRISAQTSATIYPNETWLNLHDGVSDLEFLQQYQLNNPERGLINASVYTTELNTFATDPLSLGLIGLLYLSFLVVLILSVISLLTYATLTAQARRSEFGVLQAMGLSSSRLTYSLALEQVIVVGISMILGAILGAVLSSQVLPALANSTSTQIIAPPFLVQIQITSIIQYGASIVGMLTIVLVTSLILVRRLSLSQALRLGEE